MIAYAMEEIKTVSSSMLGYEVSESPLGSKNAPSDYGGLEQDENNDLLVFQTKRPNWNASLSAWTLNFNGRVKMPSKKNFLVVPSKVWSLTS